MMDIWLLSIAPSTRRIPHKLSKLALVFAILDGFKFDITKCIKCAFKAWQNFLTIIRAMLSRIPNGSPQSIQIFLLPRPVRDNAIHFLTKIQSRIRMSCFWREWATILTRKLKVSCPNRICASFPCSFQANVAPYIHLIFHASKLIVSLVKNQSLHCNEFHCTQYEMVVRKSNMLHCYHLQYNVMHNHCKNEYYQHLVPLLSCSI